MERNRFVSPMVLEVLGKMIAKLVSLGMLFARWEVRIVENCDQPERTRFFTKRTRP